MRPSLSCINKYATVVFLKEKGSGEVDDYEHDETKKNMFLNVREAAFMKYEILYTLTFTATRGSNGPKSF